MKKTFLLIFMVIAVIVFGDLPTVFADDVADDEFLLEEVTVTAQKREENLQDAAISITAITGDDLKEEGKYRLDELLLDVIGVQLETDSYGTKVIIRGATDNLRTLNTADTPTAIYIDGILVSDVVQTRTGQYDMVRAEVLRGPQGTLYGYNSLAGSVNLISNDPSLDAFGTSATLELGNYSLIHSEGVVNVPLSDNFGMRVAVSGEDRDGYNSNDSNDQESAAGRIKFLYKPNDDFRLVFSGEHSYLGGNGPEFISFFASDGLIEERDDPWYTPTDLGDSKRESTVERLTMDINWDLGFASLIIKPSYSLFNQDTVSDIPGEESYTTDRTPLVSSEIRLASPSDSPFQWTTGVAYMKKDVHQTTWTAAYGSTLTPFNVTKSRGAFAQGTYPISERMRVTAGVRYTLDVKESKKVSNAGVVAIGIADFNAFTWKLALEADILSDTLVYGMLSTGFRSGGWYYLPSVGMKPYEPMEILSYQIGSKSRFFDNRLQVNGEIYYYDYSNYQLSWAQRIGG